MGFRSDNTFWVTPSVQARFPAGIRSLDEVEHSVSSLVVCGGGSMMDEAKYFRALNRPEMHLTLIPTIWGSGAECSPICVLNRAPKKEIHVDVRFLPDEVQYLPDLVESIPDDRARWACADVWAHALEAFCSPLAAASLRSSISELIRRLAGLPAGRDSRWFHASAEAVRYQAQSSVGLIHGIAHVLEPSFWGSPDAGWGHARLCAAVSYPVLQLNWQVSQKIRDLFTQYGLNWEEISKVVSRLYRQVDYEACRPHIARLWPQILRDQCTRTNGSLVRPQQIEFFEEWAFE